MPPTIISIVIKDWIKSSFLINILLDEEKINSLNISMLININCRLTVVINY